MTLNGIDIANYQASLVPKRMRDTEYIIVKATESDWYVNECFASHAAQVAACGKKLGCYHFARPGDMKEQADYFVGVIKDYIGKAVLALDWEENAVPLGPKQAKIWLDRVYKRTGTKPVIYMSKSVCNAFDWSIVTNAGYELWGAQYPDYSETGWKLHPWTDSNPWGAWGDKPLIFQYTSCGMVQGYGNHLDLDLFYGTTGTWDKLAKGSAVKKAVTKVLVSTPKPVDSKIAKMVNHAIDIAKNPKSGYSQVRRWGPDYDCSSLMYECASFAGYKVPTSGTRYTGTMVEHFKAAGFKVIPYSGNMDDLEWGDILLAHNDYRQHTEICIGNGNTVGAHIAETGDVDGEPGDQTGNEISVAPIMGAWDWILRPPAEKDSTPASDPKTPAKKKSVNTIAKEVIKGKWGNGTNRKNLLEAAGYDYYKVQARVNQLLKNKGKTVDQLAREVIQGKWGNGETRRTRLEAAGYDYEAVQRRVNELL